MKMENAQTENSAAGGASELSDLAMLVARLARKLRKATPADELPAQALDYLNRNGLKGSPLRKVGAGDTAVQGDMLAEVLRSNVRLD